MSNGHIYFNNVWIGPFVYEIKEGLILKGSKMNSTFSSMYFLSFNRLQ